MKPSDIKQMINSALTGVRQALRAMLLGSDATQQVILIQATGLNGESFNGAELFQQPGFRSNPLPGMQPIIVPLNGKSAAGVVVAMSNGRLFIVDLAPGEAAIFNESDGGTVNSIVLRNGGIMNITCNTANLTAADSVNVTAADVNLQVSGNVTGSAAAWDLTGPFNLNGNMAITGNQSTTGIAQVTGAITGGAGLSVAGDILSDGASYQQHTHNVPDGVSGPPQQ